MIAVLLDGTSRYFHPGSAICGVGFKQVTLDFEDCRPEHRDWLNLTLSTRMMESNSPTPTPNKTPRDIKVVIGDDDPEYLVTLDRLIKKGTGSFSESTMIDGIECKITVHNM